jgi:hypothetical protein
VKAKLFFGIALLDHDYSGYPDIEAISPDDDAVDVVIGNLSDAIHALWNSRLFDKELTQFGVETGKYTYEDCEQLFLAVTDSLVETSEIVRLGKMTPDPDEWKNRIDKGIALVEEKLEKEIGHRVCIPTRGEIQWHLAFHNP